MTEEQIKHKAEAYAEKNKHAEVTLNQMAYAAYIAGAHSRDEEIEQLKRGIGFLSAKIARLNTEIEELKKNK